MAHNTYRKPGGNWAGITTLLSSDMTFLDQLLYKQINGDDGGTWAPSTVITIGGAGLTVSGEFRATDVVNLEIHGNSFLADGGADLTLDGMGTILTVQNNAAIDIEELCQINMKADAYIVMAESSQIACQGGIVVNSPGGIALNTGTTQTFASGSQLDLASGSQLNLASGSTMSLGAVVTPTSAGRIKRRPFVTSTNVNVSLSVATDDGIIYTHTDSSNYTITINIATGTAPSVGDEMLVRINQPGVTGTVTVKNEGSAANLISMADGEDANLLLVFDGTMWRVFSHIGAGSLGADAS